MSDPPRYTRGALGGTPGRVLLHTRSPEMRLLGTLVDQYDPGDHESTPGGRLGPPRSYLDAMCSKLVAGPGHRPFTD